MSGVLVSTRRRGVVLGIALCGAVSLSAFSAACTRDYDDLFSENRAAAGEGGSVLPNQESGAPTGDGASVPDANNDVACAAATCPAAGGRCAVACSAACQTTCNAVTCPAQGGGGGGGGGCDFDCPSGATCNITCPEGAGGCNVVCHAGATCKVNCQRGPCQLNCEPGAPCSIACGSGQCDVDCLGSADSISCGGGAEGCTSCPK